MALTFRQKESYAMTRLPTSDSVNDGFSSEEGDEEAETINFRFNVDDDGVATLSSQSRDKAKPSVIDKNNARNGRSNGSAVDKLIDVGEEEELEEEEVLYRRHGKDDDDDDDLVLNQNNNVAMDKWDVTKPATCLQSFKDFSNVFKAFIGSNYLGMPYAFAQSGIIAGLFGLFLIAGLTGHCCNLIVRCKKMCVTRLVDAAVSFGAKNGTAATVSETDLLTDVGRRQRLREKAEKNMTYGHIGRQAFGKTGEVLVAVALVITQLGFCVNYFIFVGNTIHTLFPSEPTYNLYTSENISVAAPLLSFPPTLTTMMPTTTIAIDEYRRRNKRSADLEDSDRTGASHPFSALSPDALQDGDVSPPLLLGDGKLPLLPDRLFEVNDSSSDAFNVPHKGPSVEPSSPINQTEIPPSSSPPPRITSPPGNDVHSGYSTAVDETTPGSSGNGTQTATLITTATTLLGEEPFQTNNPSRENSSSSFDSSDIPPASTSTPESNTSTEALLDASPSVTAPSLVDDVDFHDENSFHILSTEVTFSRRNESSGDEDLDKEEEEEEAAPAAAEGDQRGPSVEDHNAREDNEGISTVGVGNHSETATQSVNTDSVNISDSNNINNETFPTRPSNASSSLSSAITSDEPPVTVPSAERTDSPSTPFTETYSQSNSSRSTHSPPTVSTIDPAWPSPPSDSSPDIPIKPSATTRSVTTHFAITHSATTHSVPTQSDTTHSATTPSTTPVSVTTQETTPESISSSASLPSSSESFPLTTIASGLSTKSEDATLDVRESTTANVPSTTSTTNSTVEDESGISTAPPYILLVLLQVPIQILFSFYRDVRQLGTVSWLANIAIFIGFSSVFFFFYIDFSGIAKDILFVHIKTLPLFIGAVSSAYEGVGTIIPIESSMQGNRHRFRVFLNAAIFLVTVILGSFGISGYLCYGSDVNQIITKNLPSDLNIVKLTSITLCIGIIFTYPLQMFPIIETLEPLFFGLFCCNSESNLRYSSDSKTPLLDEGDEFFSSDDGDPKFEPTRSVSDWKRNLFRATLVLLTSGLAMFLKNYFFYVSALLGSVGSITLAYILPCFFHLCLCRRGGGGGTSSEVRLPWSVWAKDVAIILIGIATGALGLYSVIKTFLDNPHGFV